jgi:hypothetical protein
VDESIALGVPVIAQVKELITSGEGRAGEIVHEVTAAPRLSIVGVILRAVPTEPE